jgi:hypothetical protein
MSRLLNSIPYILAGGTVLLGIFQLIKEWDEYENLKFPWLRRAVLALLVLVGALTFVSLRLDNKTKEEEKNKAESDIRELKTKVQAANDAQSDNTKLFLRSFSDMSKEVGDLKAEVKTDALQKKLASVQAELQKTQKSLEPGPKAEITFSFVPFNNPPANTQQPATPVTDVTLPINPDGSVHVECAALNLTSVEASNVDLNIQICDQCKYAKEPDNSKKLPGFPDTVRLVFLPRLQALQSFVPLNLDVIPPPNAQSFPVGFSYRCSTCILPRGGSLGTVHISR